LNLRQDLIANAFAVWTCSVALKKKRRKNPFYPLLVLAGLVFAITACGYALMMVRGINATNTIDPIDSGGLMQFFQAHGFTALMVELAVLALATFAAMATDEMWEDRLETATALDPEPVSTSIRGERSIGGEGPELPRSDK